MEPIRWNQGVLELIDQTKLPGAVEIIFCTTWQRVAEAITRLEVRGAPAIGVAAAFGIVLAAKESKTSSQDFFANMKKAGEALKQTRPTAVNLFWAVDRMQKKMQECTKEQPVSDIYRFLEKEALSMLQEDLAVNHQMSLHGASLFSGNPVSVLTHCNAGALATVGQGTALGVIRQAWKEGKITGVYADETRPLLQGSRLTAWELEQDGIPVTLITDNMAGWTMCQKKVQAVIVGADRIAANGDTANKIGTYSLAILAKEHGIPFYVAAPLSTFDFSLSTGAGIIIEERAVGEVTHIAGTAIAPLGVSVFNPAFDVTPHKYITAIITERGVLQPPFASAIQNLLSEKR